jgi:hypothetical protein
MRPSRLLVILIAAVVVGADAQVIATGTNWPGVQVSFDARLEPPPGPGTDAAVLRELKRDVPGGVIVNDGVHRYWKDAEQKAYLGYDVTVASTSPGLFQLRIAPLTLLARQMATAGIAETWTRLPLPQYPVISDLRAGDSVAIDLMVNPSTGQKLVDHLTIDATQPHAPPGAHDFPAPELFLNHPRVFVNGVLVPSTAGINAGIKGGPLAPVWFYWQGGEGRLLFSLAPDMHSRLKKLGEVSGNVITIHDGADTIRIECSDPIAPGAGPYNLYVLHDRSWRPSTADANEPYMFGSAAMGSLLGRR